MKMTKAQKKVGKVMGEYKSGTLHSGKGGKVVKSPKQAIAIAMSEAKMPMRSSSTEKKALRASSSFVAISGAFSRRKIPH